MANPGREEMRRRLDLVERTIQERGWSGRVCRGLADHLGVTQRTIREYRQRVLEDIAQGYRGIDRELARGEFLLRVRENMAEAKRAGRYGPVAAMLNIEGRTLGVYQDAATITHQADEPASLDDVIQRLQELPEPVRRKLAETLTGDG